LVQTQQLGRCNGAASRSAENRHGSARSARLGAGRRAGRV
jgi:hypothetical protein